MPFMQEKVADPDVTENVLPVTVTPIASEAGETGVNELEGDDVATLAPGELVWLLVHMKEGELVWLLVHKKESDGDIVCDGVGRTETDGVADVVLFGFTHAAGILVVTLCTGAPAQDDSL